jgi:hypothetical protein
MVAGPQGGSLGGHAGPVSLARRMNRAEQEDAKVPRDMQALGWHEDRQLRSGESLRKNPPPEKEEGFLLRIPGRRRLGLSGHFRLGCG